MVPQPPLVIGPLEIAAFLLANVIICVICGPKLLVDWRRWRS